MTHRARCKILSNIFRLPSENCDRPWPGYSTTVSAAKSGICTHTTQVSLSAHRQHQIIILEEGNELRPTPQSAAMLWNFWRTTLY